MKIKVRQMWVTPGFEYVVSSFKSRSESYPVCVIPTDAASVEEMVERAAKAAMDWERNRYGRLGNSNTETYRMQARAVVRDLLGLKGRNRIRKKGTEAGATL